MNVVITMIAAFGGALGFAILFGVRRELLLPASLGGLISWGTFQMFTYIFTNKYMFLNCFLATAISAIYVHVVAYTLKAATTVFLLPTIITLVPGSNLYYTFLYLYKGELANAIVHIGQLSKIVFSIAAGMTVIWAIKIIYRNIKRRYGRAG